MFERILYVAGAQPEPDAALRRAVRLARKAEASLTAVATLEPAPAGAHALEADRQRLETIVAEDRRRRLEEAVAPHRRTGVRIETAVLTGRPVDEIVRTVVRSRFDLVIKLREPLTGRRRRRPGAIDLKLLRQCPCPVWIDSTESGDRVARILVPLDVDATDHAKVALADRILEVATSIARLEGATLDVLHAWSAYGEVELRSPLVPTSRAALRDYLRAEEERHAGWLRDALERYRGGVRTRKHLGKGPCDRVILRFIAREKPDLVVMGTIARTGLPGRIAGNTAEGVLAHVECGVVAVKPPGFATSIKLE